MAKGTKKVEELNETIAEGVVGAPEETTEEVVEDKKASKKEKGVANVVNGDVVVRTYSKEVHGEDFAKLAKDFAFKKGFEVR